MNVALCRLTDANGLEIIVNPHSIRYLVSGPQGTTRVCFDNAHTVNVRGTPRETQQKLTDGAAGMEVWTPSRPEG